MGLFNLFKKKKIELTEEQIKWNKMWELWAQGEAESPYAELMTYHSEINNGGHGQYFCNEENNDDLSEEISALETILSDKLVTNLHNAYKAHLILEENEEDEKAEEIIEQCDVMYFANEEEINKKLESYANTIQI
ncbi:MAG: DUF4375 domain-containing protein [Clostridia bacterium]|nr:DUF4375 domain-containing protein [Clostridia bacterium]